MSDQQALPDFMLEQEGLTWALARAQYSFQPITKSHEANAGSYKYKYADLADVLTAIRPALNREGIALVQTTEITDAGVELVTSLLHGDERLSSRWPLPIANSTPQQVGSVLTYLRRYALCALVGIAAEDDDDGRAAGDVRQQSGRDFSRGPAPIPATTPVDSSALAAAHPPDKPIAAMTVADLIRYAREIGVPVSGSKTDMVNTLAPYVLAATGEEPWPLDDKPANVTATEIKTMDDVPFEPVVAAKPHTTGTERHARDSSSRAAD